MVVCINIVLQCHVVCWFLKLFTLQAEEWEDTSYPQKVPPRGAVRLSTLWQTVKHSQ